MKKKNTYAQVHFQFTFIILRPDGLSIQLPLDPLQETALSLKCDKYHTTLVFSACLKANC